MIMICLMIIVIMMIMTIVHYDDNYYDYDGDYITLLVSLASFNFFSGLHEVTLH